MQSISEKIKTNKENIAQQQTKNTSQDQDLSSLSQAIDELNKSVKNTYLPLTGGELTGPVSSNAKISSPLFDEIKQVYNAVYNDYAEFFPRGEETEPGDLISLNLNSDKEQYIKASSENPCVVGIHSDEFAHLIGGEEPENGENFVEYNLPKYIPVSLAGRVRVKFMGRAIKGAYAVPSDIPGVAMMSKNPNNSIGIIVEADNREDIKRIKILLRK